ncbi:MAG TPA: hypothetical protein VFQ50_03760 [Flavobacterium sp.]|jgi:uncharacterized protein (DUF2267 family)|nr:hypothetical protein [Flavobacterium sp.]
MEALVKLVAQRTGISEEQATTAVQTVVGYLKDKLPGSLGEQVEAYVKTGNTDGLGNLGDSLKDKMGGIFGK